MRNTERSAAVAGVRQVLLTLAGAAALVVGTPGTSAEQAAPAQTFRARVDVVQLDVSVLDRRGQPVRGLTLADFTVFEDGRPQRLVAMTAIEAAEAPIATAPWMREVSADVADNTLDGTRLFVIVLDDALIPQEPAFIRDTKHIATEIIARLGPSDLAAVVFTGDNRG